MKLKRVFWGLGWSVLVAWGSVLHDGISGQAGKPTLGIVNSAIALLLRRNSRKAKNACAKKKPQSQSSRDREAGSSPGAPRRVVQAGPRRPGKGFAGCLAGWVSRGSALGTLLLHDGVSGRPASGRHGRQRLSAPGARGHALPDEVRGEPGIPWPFPAEPARPGKKRCQWSSRCRPQASCLAPAGSPALETSALFPGRGNPVARLGPPYALKGSSLHRHLFRCWPLWVTLGTPLPLFFFKCRSHCRVQADLELTAIS